MGFFDWIRKKTGEEIPATDKGKELDYWKLQDIADELGEEITVRIRGGQEVVITPNVEDEGRDRNIYSW